MVEQHFARIGRTLVLQDMPTIGYYVKEASREELEDIFSDPNVLVVEENLYRDYH